MPEHEEFINRLLKLVAKRMKELRIEQGYTNYERFAFESEISRSQYFQYEKGADMRLSSLFRVLKGLGVNPDDFFNEVFKEAFEGKKEKQRR